MNVLLAALLVGNELGTWAAIHPALRSLPERCEVAAEQAITRRYGAIMPALMTLTIVSGVPVLSLVDDKGSAEFWLTAAGTAAFAAMLAVTFVGNIPVNKRVLAFGEEEGAGEWRRLRRRWDRFHAVRVALDAAGLGCLVAGVLAAS